MGLSTVNYYDNMYLELQQKKNSEMNTLSTSNRQGYRIDKKKKSDTD